MYISIILAKGKFKNMDMDGKVVGQGTHGIIKVINDRQVIKIFENRIDNRFGNKNVSSSDYEFIIQDKIYNTDCKIRIPKVGKFGIVDGCCYYEMDYIYPPFGNNVLVQLDMAEPYKDELLSGVGRFLGYENISLVRCNITCLEELAYEIGKIFSMLHYILLLDGFDCELVIGQLWSENMGLSCSEHIFLIDFDKVSRFEFVLGYVVNRKIDENMIEKRVLSSVGKFAWFLFNGLTGMSLLPRDGKLKKMFLEGYASNVGNLKSQLEKDIYDEIVKLVFEY